VDLYQKAHERSKQVTDAGFTLIEMWECQWAKTKEYKYTCNNIALKPSTCFGGRSNASKLKVQNKILKYIDVCRL
jgi:hypothetical protein